MKRNQIKKRWNGRIGSRAGRGIVIALCGALAVWEAGAALNALAAEGEKNTAEQPAEKENGQADEIKVREGKISKEETVYVLTEADGAVRKLIVSDWLKNAPGQSQITDRSWLDNVENVKGNETWFAGEDGKLIWNTEGNDIFYQGNIEKELPVDISVTYQLDGKAISPSELAGKSGKVRIRYDYTNRQYESVEVNGVRTKIYVPFVMVTGIILDDDIFSNVEVTNGRLVNEGDRTAVLGVAFPGMQESLGIDEEKLSLPEYVEITADVKDFEMGMTVTIAANQSFGGFEGTDEELTDGISRMLDELTDAMEQLMDGSVQLYDGLDTLLEKSGELVEGIGRLSDGASALKSGAAALDEGVGKLQGGASALQAGLNTLSSKNGELTGGAKQVFDTLLATAQSQLNAAGINVSGMTVDNYGQVLNEIISSLDSDAVYQQALSTVTAKVEEQRGYIETQVGNAVGIEVRSQVEAAVAAGARDKAEAQAQQAVRQQVVPGVIQAATGMTQADYEAAIAAGAVDEDTQAKIQDAIEKETVKQMESDAVQSQIQAGVDGYMASEESRALIEANYEAQMQSDTVKNLIASNVEAQVQEAISKSMASAEVQGQLGAASEGLKSVAALKASLDSYNSFYQGLQAYTAGVSQAAGGAGELVTGAGELKAGSNKLSAGAGELYDGIRTMQAVSPELIDGIDQLRAGAKQLSEGLEEFNGEGIQKLADAADGSLKELIDRLHAIDDVSVRYQSFSGIAEDMEGQVKFIYRTDAVEAVK